MTLDAEQSDRSRGAGGAAVVCSMSVTAVGHFAGQVAWFGSLIVLGALLRPDAFGVVAAGLVIVNAGTLLMGAGTGGSIVSTKNLAASEIRSSIRLNLILGVSMTIGLLVLADPITEQFASGGNATVLRWLALAIALHSFTVVPIALLKKQMHFGRYAMVSFGSYMVAGLVAVGLGIAGGGVWSLVVRIVLYEGLLAVLALWFARSLLSGGGYRVEDDVGSKRHGGSWFFLLALADFIAFNADYLVVGRYTDAEQLGLYSLAFLLAFAPLRQFSWQIGSVLFSASVATESPAAVRRKLSYALGLGSAVLLPVVIPAVLLAPVVIPGVLGDEWEPMVPTFQVLAGTGIAHAVLNIGAEFLSGTGNVDLRGRLSVAWAIGMAASLLVVVPRHGIIGAAFVHAALFVPLALMTTLLGARRLGATARDLVVPLRHGCVAVASQGATTVLLGFLLNAVGIGTSWRLVILAVAATAVAAGYLSVGRESPLAEFGRLVRNAIDSQTAARAS